MRSIVWLRRDLRLRDNAALAEACTAGSDVVVAFVIDPQLLAGGGMSAAIVQCFFSALAALRGELRERGSDLALIYGDPAEELVRFARSTGAGAVYFNEDYEPFARARDARVSEALRAQGIAARVSLDHVYFGAADIARPDGAPYRVFTPYRRRWLEELWRHPRPIAPSLRRLRGKLVRREAIGESLPLPLPEQFGYTSSARYPACSERVARDLLDRFAGSGLRHYDTQRNYPACDGTSHLAPQLRAGTIGIRTCVQAAQDGHAWLNELIWREFYQTILRRFPHVADGPFLPQGARIAWRKADCEFDAWCTGMTGYPIVDAAMRLLKETGWMHNRLRMIVASFLAKNLLVDWRMGERYFARHLADADVAQNNGGWQWCASTGTDAVPYFRIFHPVTQGERFDPQGRFVKSVLPELADVPPEYAHAPWRAPRPPAGYPSPIVDHAAARLRALEAYGRAFRARH